MQSCNSNQYVIQLNYCHQSSGIEIPGCENAPTHKNAIYQEVFQHNQNNANIVSDIRRTIDRGRTMLKWQLFENFNFFSTESRGILFCS